MSATYVLEATYWFTMPLVRDRISHFLADTKDGQVPTSRAEARVAAHQTGEERGIRYPNFVKRDDVRAKLKRRRHEK